MCLAVPGRLVAIEHDDPAHPHGRVDYGGVARRASLALLPEAQVGDWVIVHAGVAISVLDEAEAAASLAELEALERMRGET
ncbi:MAG: HypC/HybG/HupF family hydrogenase formation chaperone [Polyangiales bacterium]